jgi:hypothetical protein
MEPEQVKQQPKREQQEPGQKRQAETALFDEQLDQVVGGLIGDFDQEVGGDNPIG